MPGLKWSNILAYQIILLKILGKARMFVCACQLTLPDNGSGCKFVPLAYPSAMNRPLAALIAAYEAEHTTLGAQLAECLADADYKRAHLFQRGLFRVNQLLHTLRRLRDPRHEEKEAAAQRIEKYEQMLAMEEFASVREYLRQQLAEAQATWAALPPVPARLAPGRMLRGLWQRLAAGELAGFELVFSQTERLGCHVRVVRRTLLLTLPELRRHRAAGTLEKRHLRQLYRLGFRPYDHDDKLLLFLPFGAEEERAAARQLLARVALEVLDFGEGNGQAFVRYF